MSYNNILFKYIKKTVCFLRRMKISIHTNCVLPRRIFKTILWLCSPWPSNVYWRFSKHVSILQGYKKRTIFVLGKFHLQKIYRCRDFVASFYSFSIKWEHKHVYCEQWTQRLHFTSQHTYTHTLCIYIYSEIFTGILEEFSVSAMWSCR